MSQETYLKSLSANERANHLQSNAHSIDEGKYSRPITADEKTMLREKHTDNAIKLSDLKEEFDEVKKTYKDNIEPYVQENKTLLSEIRTSQRIEKGTLYHLANHESGMMESYNEHGELISTRRLRPDEKQAGLFPIPKTGTNN